MKKLNYLLALLILLMFTIGCSAVDESNTDETQITQIEKFVENGNNSNISQKNVDVVEEETFTLLNDKISLDYGNSIDPLDYLADEDKNKDIRIDNPVNINLSGEYLILYTYGNVTKELQVTVMEKPETEKREIQIISLTSPVNPGQNATIQIKGTPNKIYSIIVYYKSGASKSNDLYPKESDNEGLVEWTWQVGSRTSSGEWKITIESEVDTITTYFKVN